jgi:hypothetical protein
MANNNVQSSANSSSKVFLCRKLFPELIQFLSKFDISERNGRARNDTLNMHFLLQAYRHLKNVEEKKICALEEGCKWSFRTVKEEHVLMAIDEYYEITSIKHDLISLREGLVKNAIIPGRNEKWKLEDNTTFEILKHFGINTANNKTEMGAQRQAFSDFIRDAREMKNQKQQAEVVFDNMNAKTYEELGFANAFHLLRSLRNWGAHALEKFDPDEVTRYYRFILFTHIGIIYVCRRIWNKYEGTLIGLDNGDKKKYTPPQPCITNKETVKVNIIANNTNQTISNCEYQIANGKFIPVKESNGNTITFEFEIPKYTFFSIKFECGNEPYCISRKMTYIAWNPTLTIIIEPPANIHCSCEVIGGDEFKDVDDKLSSLLSKYWSLSEIKQSNDEIKKDCEKIQNTLNNLQPAFFLLQEHVSKEKNALKNDIREDINKTLDCLENYISGKYDKLYQLINENQEQTNQNFNSLINQISGVNKQIEEQELDGYKKNKLLLSWLLPGVLSIIALSLGLWLFRVLDICNVDYSVSYIKNDWMPYVFVPILLIIGFVVYYLYTTTKYVLLSNCIVKTKGFLPYFAIVTLLFVAWACVPNKTVKNLVANYDFGANNHLEGDNAIAARLMEKYLKEDHPIEDEQVRIQLANYFLKYTGEVDKALAVSEPMFKDPKRYPNGIWAYAEVLYEKKDYDGVWTILNEYNDSSIIAECLEGTLLSRGEGCTRDVHKGLRKLHNSFDKGSKEAQYQIGRFYVNDMTDWDTPNQSVDIADMDIVRGVYFLRGVACQRPQAALEIGKLYVDLNMNDSAIYYFNKVINLAEDSLLLEAKYRMGLLAEKLHLDSLKYYMTEAKLAKYQPALIHSAIFEKDHKRIISIYEAAGRYNGYRYLPPITFEYIATNQLEKALQSLRSSHPHGKFDKEFVEGMTYIIGSDYVKRDSLLGLEQIRQSADNGCRYAQMMILYSQLEEMLEEGKEIPISQIDKLESFGKRDSIYFAYVLEANLMNREGEYDKAFHAAMMATSNGHPAGAIELRDDTSGNPKWEQYLEALEKNRSHKLWYYRTKQIALRWSPAIKLKQRAISNCYILDLGLNNKNNIYSEWRLSFWSDVVMANHNQGLGFSLLDIWMTSQKNDQSDFYKRQLLLSSLNDYKGEIDENQRQLIIATLNSLDDEKFRNFLIERYADNPVLTRILETRTDDGYRPHKSFNFTDGNFSLEHISPNVMLFELSETIGTDYFNDPFE